jgi:hypothetical protein
MSFKSNSVLGGEFISGSITSGPQKDAILTIGGGPVITAIDKIILKYSLGITGVDYATGGLAARRSFLGRVLIVEGDVKTNQTVISTVGADDYNISLERELNNLKVLFDMHVNDLIVPTILEFPVNEGTGAYWASNGKPLSVILLAGQTLNVASGNWKVDTYQQLYVHSTKINSSETGPQIGSFRAAG